MNDTSPEAREFQYAGWRRLTAAERLGQLRSCWRTGRALQALGRRIRGQAAEVEGMEQFEVTRLVTQTLEMCGVRYAVVGSIASSVHGEPRYTQDTDLIAELNLSHKPALLALGDQFSISETAFDEALRRRGSFNLIHLTTNFKVDVFVSKNRPFDRSRLDRRLSTDLGFCVATPEDVLLAKLDRFRLGHETSERQWRDIEGIIAIQPALDRAYLEHWAGELGVADLLARCFP